ncbi:hypothetical protein D3C76_1809500 [compost metagenome]
MKVGRVKTKMIILAVKMVINAAPDPKMSTCVVMLGDFMQKHGIATSKLRFPLMHWGH